MAAWEVEFVRLDAVEWEGESVTSRRADNNGYQAVTSNIWTNPIEKDTTR